MPELPELQAHAERLDERYAGSTLARFTPLTFTALKTAVPPATDAQGHDLVFVGRRGKYLLLDFGLLTFVVHLMQGGRLKEEPVGKQPAKPKTGVARWLFEDGRALLLSEAGTERRAGVWAVAGDPEGQPPLEGLGPDADAIDPPHLLELLHAHPMRLHGWLRDQRALAGIGRRLANEICHRAKLSPFASTGKLTLADAQTIVEAIHASVNESLAYERGRDNMSSSADRPGSVHHREGEACSACGDRIRTVEYTKYTVAYCPTCQTNGKTLADNTTSKFLK
ncbi:MAG TPA: DNA-formamidopyrimidine glycosylase family protein [Acidimicrobiales bacterium]|jgi:formamidopyrimidine-DNA glycosylase|nr:DNA-formamidopyrimidine glycosylase family protein [Acidimicrobiales bacterium]